MLNLAASPDLGQSLKTVEERRLPRLKKFEKNFSFKRMFVLLKRIGNEEVINQLVLSLSPLSLTHPSPQVTAGPLSITKIHKLF